MQFKRTLISVAVAALGAAAAPAMAQSTEEMRNELKALREKIETLEIKQSDAVVKGDVGNSSRVPGSETSVRLYGFAELNMVSEFKGDNSDNDYATFLPYAPINGSAQANKTGRTYLHARTSRLGVEASTPTGYGPLGIKVEGDFNNEPRSGNSAVSGSAAQIFTQQATNSYNFRLRQAYGQVGGLLIGQTWSTFMDVDNSPETVDFNGPIGATFVRQPQIRYSYGTKDMGSFTVAAENPVSYVLDSTGAVMQHGFTKFPDLVARWDKGFGWGSLSVRGVTLEHRVDDGAAIDAHRRGYGLGTTAFVKMRGGADFLSAALTLGDGIGRYFNYIEGAAYNAATNKILMEKAAGVVLGYQFKPADNLRYNFVYGWQRNSDNDYTAFASTSGFGSGRFGVNKSLKQVHVGAIYTPLKNVDLGAEYIWGQRQTLAGEKGDMSRINLSAKYYFN